MLCLSEEEHKDERAGILSDDWLTNGVFVDIRITGLPIEKETDGRVWKNVRKESDCVPQRCSSVCFCCCMWLFT